MTNAENLLQEYRNEVSIAVSSFYTWKAINGLAKTDKEWAFMDATDGSVHVLVFCPRKGAGWGFLSTLNEFRSNKK
jgi:hypothetical protein